MSKSSRYMCDQIASVREHVDNNDGHNVSTDDREKLPSKFIYKPVFSLLKEEPNDDLPFKSYMMDEREIDLRMDERDVGPQAGSTSASVHSSTSDSWKDESYPDSSRNFRCESENMQQSSSRNNSGKRIGDRTPRTLLRMMERHRENERVRHHTLNESMKKVCENVPGYADILKETKVVMMQRIIAYICFLENTIHSLCDQLNIKVYQLKMPTDFLTDQWKEDHGNSKNKAADHVKSMKYKPKVKPSKHLCLQYEKRRLKISSPTIDSTTDGFGNAVNQKEQDQGSDTELGEITQSLHVDDGYTTENCLSQDTQHTGLGSQQDTSDEILGSQYGINFNLSQDSSIPCSCSTTCSTQTPDSKKRVLTNVDVDIFLDNNACSVPEHFADTPSKYFLQNDEILPTSTSLDNFPDAFELMSSPLGKKNQCVINSAVKMDVTLSPSFGIRSDKKDYQENNELGENEMRTISPECILRTTQFDPEKKCANLFENYTRDENTVQSSLSSYLSTPSCSAPNTPIKNPELLGKNKRKQYTPRRSPFHDISNLDLYSGEYISTEESFHQYMNSSVIPYKSEPEPKRKKMKTTFSIGRFSRKSPVNEDFVSYVPYIWKFHNKAITRRQKAEAARLQGKDLPAVNVNKTEFPRKPNKVDLRKTTWMNGFMMFSRLNRRKFIEANPGVHTSHISKMMGHTWRRMTQEEQQPYKDKAQDYTQVMKKENETKPDNEESSENMFTSSSEISTQKSPIVEEPSENSETDTIK